MSHRIKKRRLPLGFGKRLENSILKSGYCYSQIEKATGVNHSNIYDYTQENMIPSAYNLFILCKFLNVSADYLLGLKGE